MTPFEWHFPTKLIYGPGRINEVGKIAVNYGKKAMLVTYSGMTPLEPAITMAVQLLTDAGLEVVVFKAIEPNPRTKTIDQAVAIFNTEKCDLVIALGGGSVIDSAKHIAATAASGGCAWDYVLLGKRACREYSGAFPIITIATISAAGSETSRCGVIQNTETKQKSFACSPYFLPKVAIVDPALLTTVPLRLTQDSCIGIFAQLIEHYLTSQDDSEFADRTAEGMILCLKDSFDKILYDLDNKEVRGQLALCSMFSWSGLQALNRLESGSIHSIGMPLSAHYDLPHSRAMVVIIPAYLEVLADVLPHRWAKLARRCFSVVEEDDLKAAKMLSGEVAKWFKSTHSFLTLSDVGIPDEKFEKMAEDIIDMFPINRSQTTVGARSITKQDIINIYKICK